MNDEISKLNFQDFLFIVFAIVCLINVRGDYYTKEYLKTNNEYYNYKSNKTFILTLKVTILIYIYFLVRNYESYQKISEDKKDLYLTKVFGSCLLIAGALLLLYFQENQNSFIGAPAL